MNQAQRFAYRYGEDATTILQNVDLMTGIQTADKPDVIQDERSGVVHLSFPDGSTIAIYGYNHFEIGAPMADPITLQTILSGPQGEHMVGDHEVSPRTPLRPEALIAAQEAARQAHGQLDQRARAEGPSQWDGWIVETILEDDHGDWTVYQADVEDVLTKILPPKDL